MAIHPLWDNVLLRRLGNAYSITWEVIAVGPAPVVEYGYETPIPDVLHPGQIVAVAPGDGVKLDANGEYIIVGARTILATLDGEEASEDEEVMPTGRRLAEIVNGKGRVVDADETDADEACSESGDGDDDSGEGTEQNHDD